MAFTHLRTDSAMKVGDVELRVVTDQHHDELAALVARGVHAPGASPFSTAWTEGEPSLVAARYVTWLERMATSREVDSWTICFLAQVDGEAVGATNLTAREFPIRREVWTGSWIGLAHQGRGLGTHMRVAALDLAFGPLGAEWAVSRAFRDNPASCRVNERVGYCPDGIEVVSRSGRSAIQNRYRLRYDAWPDLRDRHPSGVFSIGQGPIIEPSDF